MSLRTLFTQTKKQSQNKPSDITIQTKTSTQHVFESLSTTSTLTLRDAANQHLSEDSFEIQAPTKSSTGSLESSESAYRVNVNESPIQLNLIPDSENPRRLRTKINRQLPSLPTDLTTWLDHFMSAHPVLAENDKILVADFLLDELKAAQAISQSSTVTTLEQIYVEHEQFKLSNQYAKHYLSYITAQTEIKSRSEQIIQICTLQPLMAIEAFNREIRETEIRKNELIKQITRTEQNKTAFSILNPMSWQINVDAIHDNETIDAATKLHNSLVTKIRGILAQAKQIQADSPDYTLYLGAQSTLLTVYSHQFAKLLNKLETPLEINAPTPSMQYEEALTRAQKSLAAAQKEVTLLEELLEKQNRIAALEAQRLMTDTSVEEPKTTKKASCFSCIKR